MILMGHLKIYFSIRYFYLLSITELRLESLISYTLKIITLQLFQKDLMINTMVSLKIHRRLEQQLSHYLNSCSSSLNKEMTSKVLRYEGNSRSV